MIDAIITIERGKGFLRKRLHPSKQLVDVVFIQPSYGNLD
jgi:hypothetical protein